MSCDCHVITCDDMSCDCHAITCDGMSCACDCHVITCDDMVCHVIVMWSSILCAPAVPMMCSMEGGVQLDGSSALFENEGVVQACIGQEWHTICDDGWGEEEAMVVCTQLGYAPSGMSCVWHVVWHVVWQMAYVVSAYKLRAACWHVVCGMLAFCMPHTGAVAVETGYFNGEVLAGMSAIVSCHGNETHLSQCNLDLESTCTAVGMVAVICQTGTYHGMWSCSMSCDLYLHVM